MKPLSERLMVMQMSLENLYDEEIADFDEAIALAKRYEDAHVVTVTIVGQPEHGGGYDVYSIGNDYQPGNPMKAYAGQRVRIVLDKEG